MLLQVIRVSGWRSTGLGRVGKAVLAGSILIGAGLGAVGCGNKPSQTAAAAGPQAMPVQVQVAKAVPIADASEYLSVLKSRHSAIINPQVEGQIIKIYVKSGDRVQAGQPLLEIDPLKQQAMVSSQEASRTAQQANVNYARIQLERQKKLFEAGVVSKQEFDNAQTTYDAAVAQLKSLEDQVKSQTVELRYYQVSAPMSGIVGDIPVRMGDRVTTSTMLTTVDEPGALEAYIYVPVDRSRGLRLGLPVHLLDTTGKEIAQTQITFVSPQVDTETQTVLAKAAIPNQNDRLRIAQQVRAQIIWGTTQGPVVPILAVTRINGQFFAFLAESDGGKTVARQKAVKIGDTVGNDYAVLDGIKPGDHIIVSGTQFLQDGMPVAEQIQNAPANANAGGTPMTEAAATAAKPTSNKTTKQ